MDKLKMQTPDLTDKNIERIASLFPNVITETKDENGNTKKAVDFDLLKTTLSKNLVDFDDERYRLDWPGKKASLLKANTPITKTLRPCREESVNFDTTQNLYIEGDNFEVLKILQESYLGKIKMIYIDPPYNTGTAMIYHNDFSKSEDEYEQEIGAVDEESGKLFKNNESNGRFHSDWLSMMYERILIARDLLGIDGIIAVAIDDNEQFNLKKILDEVFGEENFVGTIITRCNPQGRGKKNIDPVHEYHFIYAKDIEKMSELKILKRGVQENAFGYFLRSGTNSRKNERPKRYYPMLVKENEVFMIKKDEYLQIYSKENGFNETVINALIDKYENLGYTVIFPTAKNGEAKVWQREYNRAEREHKTYIYEGGQIKIPINKDRTPISLWSEEIYSNSAYGANKLKELFSNERTFDYPKSYYTVMDLISIGENSLVLDFFSGSATTAHAVMQLNAEDGGNRKFIMVQLPEKTDESSEAYKADYKTISDIGKERIRRAGKKIVEELKTKNKQLEIGKDPVDPSKLDIGFRVYKTDESNMKDVFYHPAELNQKQLAFLESNIKEDRTPEDLLTQVILDLGLELSLPIETKKIGKNTVFIVQTNALVACFDNDIDFKIVDIIADLKPFKVVFKDASFKDDKDRINVEERFKRLSPETKVTVI
jgi:adenine-specific DNA-methyltransferase